MLSLGGLQNFVSIVPSESLVVLLKKTLRVGYLLLSFYPLP